MITCHFTANTIVWEIALADSALVVLDEWSSYRGGRLSRFNYTQCLERLHTHTEITSEKIKLTKNLVNTNHT